MKRVYVQLEVGRGYGRDLLKGIYDYNHRYSNWEIIFEPAYYLKNNPSRDPIKTVELLKPDGCILERMGDASKLSALDVPVIQASRVQDEVRVPFIMGNYEADGRMAVDYFVGLGFINLGFFGISNLEWSSGRLESFKRHSAEKGILVAEYKLKMNDPSGVFNDYDDLVQWLWEIPKPIGVFCCNDDFAQILINACSMGGIKVPGEVAVLGVDNDELLCNITYPKLSSIARNETMAAYKACELLDRMMNGEEIQDVVIPTEPVEVVVRSSTDTIACNDVEVIKAIHYIREYIHKPLTVEDIVEVTNISRRSLYSRFKRITGNTINEEIQIQKLKKFKELLKNRNLSIKEAAFSLGFSDVSHVSRWFSSIEGIPPVLWRNEHFHHRAF